MLCDLRVSKPALAGDEATVNVRSGSAYYKYVPERRFVGFDACRQLEPGEEDNIVALALITLVGDSYSTIVMGRTAQSILLYEDCCKLVTAISILSDYTQVPRIARVVTALAL